jgi:DNA (cytosine-5)-methyltransferase 1
VTRLAVDLFAGGARGWDLHDTEFGLLTVGYESDETAHATATAAGFHGWCADVSRTDVPEWSGRAGLKASPPCQTFSMSGKGAGRQALEAVYAAMGHLHQTGHLDYAHFSDTRTGLVLEPLRWALDAHRAGRPFRWIVLEQVPPVLPVWERMAKVLESLGYSVVTGNLHAEQYGVPQTRKRAVLVARLDGEARLPTPTHSRYHSRNPTKLDAGVAKWVSMAEALGRGLQSRPSPTITGGGTETGGAEPIAHIHRYIHSPDWAQRSNYSNSGQPGQTAEERGRTTRTLDEPSVMMTSKAGQWVSTSTMPNATHRQLTDPAPTIAFGKDAASYVFHGGQEDIRTAKRNGHVRRITVAEAAVLQTLPAAHPWQGNKGQQYLQVGNAIPGLLAKAILREVLS